MKLPSSRLGAFGDPDVTALLRDQGLLPPQFTSDPAAPLSAALRREFPELTHGTTICAVRHAGGVVMAGDRRATAGNVIAHRAMEKIYPADRFSGVAIAGAAGAAMEMVRLFQLQLEHFEKLEGAVLSFEGKANFLAQMVRSNLPNAIQMGLVVVPLFAGYDLRRRRGRIFTFDVTGGRYEETDFQAEGSGGRDARTTIKLSWREGMARDEAVELVIRALWQAADEDSATGGPDPIRGIYPMVATITEAGFEEVAEPEVAERFAALLERTPGGLGITASPAAAPTPPDAPAPTTRPARKGRTTS